MSNTLLRPLCWIERHHWLLQREEPQTFYAENGLPRASLYHYQCQRCNKWSYENIVNLDNAPDVQPSETVEANTKPTSKLAQSEAKESLK